MSGERPYQQKFLQFRTLAAPSDAVYLPNQNVDPSANLNGAVLVQVVDESGGNFEYENGYAASHALVTEALALRTLNGFNDSETATYVQIFETAPTPTDAPVQSFLVPGKSSFSWTPSRFLTMAGLYVASSTTPNEYNADVAVTWVHVEFNQ
jgi:hypothetical protein